MLASEYKEIEIYMLNQMRDSAHDKHHVYRVLNFALDIAAVTDISDPDVLLAACLLHDIGREMQFSDINICHAQAGGDMAYEYLLSRRWPSGRASHVKECVSTHRFRKNNRPKSIEAQILFDADKLDACGALGIARTLIYGGQVAEPLYLLDDDEKIIAGGGGEEMSSFMQEYNYKLKNVYTAFYTKRAKEIARKWQKTAISFYDGLHMEITSNYENGAKKHLTALLERT